MALLQPVFDELLEVTTAALPALQVAEDVVVAGLRRRDERPIENVLTIELVVPATWSDALRHWAQDWLLLQADHSGLDARRFDVRVTALDDAHQVWRHATRIIDHLAGAEGARWHLLLACASFVDAGIVGQWLAHGVLATAQAPDGRTPGEGAAGVLLASPRLGQDGDVRIWRPHLLQAGQVEGTRPAEQRRQLAALAAQWRASLGSQDQAVQFVLHDADHRGDLMVDAAAITATLNPDLEFSPQSLALAVSAGELGPVLPLAQLALGQAQLYRQPDPVLLLGVADAEQRLFGLLDLLPSPTPAHDAPAAT